MVLPHRAKFWPLKRAMPHSTKLRESETVLPERMDPSAISPSAACTGEVLHHQVSTCFWRRLNGRNATGLTGFICTILPGFGRLLLHCGQKAVISGRGRCFGGLFVPAKIAAQAELRAVGAVPVKQAFFGVSFALGFRARNRGAKFLFALVGVQVPAAGKPQRQGQPAYRRWFGIHNNGQAVFVQERFIRGCPLQAVK